MHLANNFEFTYDSSSVQFCSVNDRKWLHISTLLSTISKVERPSHTTRMSPSKPCPSCERALTLPPSISDLLETYPNAITPQYGLNRDIPRCKHCDLIEANKRAMDAELPPPEYKDPVLQIERHMDEARQYILGGVRKQEMMAALARMEDRRREIIVKRDGNIRMVWEEYWGIWGPEASGIGSLY